MSARDDGGPAFPVLNGGFALEQDGAPLHGISVRDYFAIRALPMAVECHPDGHVRGWLGIAEHAYAIADAMLKARQA